VVLADVSVTFACVLFALVCPEAFESDEAVLVAVRLVALASLLAGADSSARTYAVPGTVSASMTSRQRVRVSRFMREEVSG
jgi:uncharacterized membrane protein